MSHRTGVEVLKGQIRDSRAAADIEEVEARRYEALAGQSRERAEDARRVADELEALLPADEES